MKIFLNKRMRPLVAGFTVVLLVLASVMAYARPAPAPAPAPGWKWPATLTMATPGLATEAYNIWAGVMPIMESMTGMRIRLLPEDNAAARARWLKGGRVPFYSEPMAEVAGSGMEGIGGYATRDGGPFQLRIVWKVSASWFGFIVRGDSPIKTVYDIKPGHKIAYFAGPTGPITSMRGLLAWAGVPEKDVVMVPCATWGSNILSVPEGRADVALASPGSPETIKAETSPSGIRWLSLPVKEDPKGATRFLACRPTLLFGEIRAGAKSAIGVMATLSPSNIYTTADQDPVLVYSFAKWLGDNYPAYKNAHPTAHLLGIDYFRSILDTTYLPVHDGTIKYLKEKKMWTAADDARQKYNVNLLTKYVEAYKAAIGMADKKGIRVDPTNKEWIELWENYKKELVLPSFKVMLEIPK